VKRSKLVVVGIGPIGAAHLAVLRKKQDFGEVELGICSRNPKVLAGDLTEVPKNNLGIEVPNCYDTTRVSTYSSFEECLGDSSVTGVLICTPTATHYEMARRAMKAGKHVLVEKPACIKPGEVENFRQLLGEHPGIVCGVGQVLPYFYDFFALRRLLTGKTGITLELNRFVYANNPISSPEMADQIGSAWMDLAVHDLHLARSMFGWPEAEPTILERISYSGYVRRVKVQWTFPGNNTVVVDAGVKDDQQEPFWHGFSGDVDGRRFEYRLGWEGVRYSTTPDDSHPVPEWDDSRFAGSDVPFAGEHHDFLKGIEQGELSKGCALDPHAALDAVTLALQAQTFVPSLSYVRNG
jgi:predicted dehydrogenase